MKTLVSFITDFRSVVGCFAVGSLVVLPIWLFALHKGLIACLSIPLSIQHSVSFALITGRILCLFVEVCASFVSTICCLCYV